MKIKNLLLSLILAVFLIIGGLLTLHYLKYTTEQAEKPQNGNNSSYSQKVFIVPEINRELVVQKINDGKEFLLRTENQETNGFYKMYDAVKDDFGKQVYTVYSASSVYTLLNIYEFDKDERIANGIDRWANFLLSMQNNDKKDKRYGAFSYSYDLEKKEKEKKFVVGTSALTILTLLKLYELNNDLKYLESSKLAGNWLITMQEEDGGMRQYTRYNESKQKWVSTTKESFLYNGQVLTALSRLYKKTGDKKYYDSAEKIALRFAELYEEKRDYIVDEVRPGNPISNSWVVMSLMEFYKHTNPDKRYKDIVFELSDRILQDQKKDKNDVVEYGAWRGYWGKNSYTSGIGWIAEVMTELNKFCEAENRNDCSKYQESALLAVRWLVSRTYSSENTSSFKNPAMAIGGIPRHLNHKEIRTDSNCHGLNSYLGIVNSIE